MAETNGSGQRPLDILIGFFNKAVPIKLLFAVVVVAVLPFIAPHLWKPKPPDLLLRAVTRA
jgi:hypothetical protein